ALALAAVVGLLGQIPTARITTAVGAATPVPVAPQQLSWVRQLPPRKPAWQRTPRMPRDAAYEPVVCGDLVLVGCCHNDALLAIDAATGQERWRFYTNGPIRFAPVVAGDRLYIGSDDGYLYCLEAAQGRLAWKFRGGPSERKVIGHERVISAWPVSARLVVAQGRAVVVAGHWPLDGIFVCALDAATGRLLWTSDTVQFRPVGALRVQDRVLFVEGIGGSGAFDAETGAAAVNVKPMRREPPAPPAITPEVEGDVAGAFTAGERLFVSTRQGRLYAFGPNEGDARVIAPARAPRRAPVVAVPQIAEGYALVLGLKTGQMVEALLANPKVQVVAIDPDPKTVERLRRQFDEQGLFDDYRLAVHVGDPEKFGLPPYMASLIVSETDLAPSEAILRSLRPYGGLFASGGRTVRRDGPLPDAAEWTHEFANEGNTLSVYDRALKPPLGIQWYEGPAADMALYYDGDTAHDAGDALSPLPPGAVFVNGRMFLQGPGVLAAFDIYTGREFWRTAIPKTYVFHGVGIHSQRREAPEPWNYAPALRAEVPSTHRPRATGFNCVAAADGIYVAAGRRCLRYDPADGRLISDWKVPLAGELCWGNLRICGNVLVATAFRPQDLVDAKAGLDGNGGEWAKDRMPMAYLVALDRQSGRCLWSRQAAWGFLNQGMAVGGGKVYCVDLVCENVLAHFKEAGRKLPDAAPAILALDLQTGGVAWTCQIDVLIKQLTYSAERDVLLAPSRTLVVWQGGSWTETDKKAGRMRTLRGKDGKVLWEVAETLYYEPHIILHDLIIDRYGWTFDLATGRRAKRISPLSGQEEPWQIKKAGCNHLIASESIVTWRTAFYDLAGIGSVPLKGMEAGCTPSLVVSGGVLNSPNYGTRLKRPRMTTLAMVHQPDNEMWSRYEPDVSAAQVPLRKVGFNFGAPGDSLGPDGTLWLNVAPKEMAGVTVQPADVAWFCHRASPADNWIAASCVAGATEIAVPTRLAKEKKRPQPLASKYTVRLYFAEPEQAKPGERVFSISIQGKEVLKDFDIAHEAARAGRPVFREFNGVAADPTIRIGLSPSTKKPAVLCGVQIVLEGE
ncbi:MAG: hypothetical protein FJ288_12615, partial [Planctomycetes bacterium]|nr:hypothetical protein [Planctomycetota bacterium]